jgi:ATP-dependent Zn protease
MNVKSKVVIAIVIAIAAAVALGFGGYSWTAVGTGRGPSKVTYSEFLEKVRAGQVAGAIVAGSAKGAIEASIRLKDGETQRTVLPRDYRSALEAMQEQRVNVEILGPSAGPLRVLFDSIPFLVLAGTWLFFILRRSANGPGQGIWRW